MDEPKIIGLSDLESHDINKGFIIRIEAFNDVRQIPAACLLSPHLKAIEIDFPSFRDGRGFSSARILRDELNYKGPLKAIGDVLKDQLFVMLRSGFDHFDLKDPNPDLAIETAKLRFRHVYQSASDNRQSMAELRKAKT
jgi:uncharacterized protein (DUF934 family)